MIENYVLTHTVAQKANVIIEGSLLYFEHIAKLLHAWIGPSAYFSIYAVDSFEASTQVLGLRLGIAGDYII